MNKAMTQVMLLLRWVLIVAYLQLIFVVGALAGFVIGGIFPSFYASILVAKGLMKTRVDYTATRKFIAYYKKIFWQANKIGWLSAFIGLVCFSNIVYFNQLQATQSWAFFVKVVWLILSVILFITFSIITPTFIDYQLKFQQLPKLILAGLGDFRSLIIVAGDLILAYLAFVYFTGIFILIILGIYILLIAAVNAGFERRKIIFEKER